MFERFTEKARRVVFFARFEASQFGSRAIETEHLLLGLLREDLALMRRYAGPGSRADAIREEIEGQITRRERFPTSEEVPLAEDAQRVLKLAAEEADRLSHKNIGTEHLLIGLLRVERSITAKVLRANGVKPEVIRQHLMVEGTSGIRTAPPEGPRETAMATLKQFLEGLKSHSPQQLISFFAKNAEFIDAFGKRRNGNEIEAEFEALFAPYAKKNAAYVVEPPQTRARQVFVGAVLWKNALLGSGQRAWVHRMSLVLQLEQDNWKILLVQVTPVQGP